MKNIDKTIECAKNPKVKRVLKESKKQLDKKIKLNITFNTKYNNQDEIVFNCDSFEFYNGFLKLINPENKNKNLYIPLQMIRFIEEYYESER